ncbi:MAG: O-antigen ligase family protein [Bacteroidota bacterium]
MPWFKKEYHTRIYIFGLLLLAASLTLSLLMMSIAEFILLFNWLAEGKFREKYLKLKESKAALVFLLIYALHVFGLFYTHNFSFALDDLRIKLPLLALPVIFVTTPLLSRKMLINVLLVHVAATFVASMVEVGIFLTTEVKDIRDISIFISHIRFALNIDLDIFILVFLVLTKNHFKIPVKIGFALLVFWLVYFLLFMESFTGIIILVVVSIILIIVYILKKSPGLYKVLFMLFLVVAGMGLFFYLNRIYVDYHKNVDTLDTTKLENYTKHGGFYLHARKSKLTDNGHYTWIYVCEEELRSAWNKRSEVKFDSLDHQHQPLRFTLIRYLTSKGLRKDMDAVNSLSDKEVSLIENGVANVELAEKGSFTNRVKTAIWEYEDFKITGDPRGRTMIQRIELWHSSLKLIKDHLWVGVGTGDAADVFAASLILQDSLLQKSELRSHNQFLTFTIAFGIIGLLIFLFALFYPGIREKRFGDFLYLAFFLIAIISMLTEDTLETQAGVTFFTFFSCLFLFAAKKDGHE